MLAELLVTALLAVMPAGKTADIDKAHWIEFIEQYFAVEQSARGYKKVMATQLEDGSWADVPYDSKLRGSWPGYPHADRFRSLACAYHLYHDTEARDAALKALEYWGRTMPTSPNWWWNVIGIPQRFGPALYLIRDELDEQHLEWALAIMDRCTFGMTGQNKVWRAGNVFFRSLLVNDTETMLKASKIIASEVCQVGKGKEGIQKDWSFHQHGPQLQFGNYGLSYAECMSWWMIGFHGTEYAFSDEQEAIIRNYVSEGLRWVVWKGYFDHSACGRQVFEDTQITKSHSSYASARRLGLAPEPETPGSRYYPNSDFGVYRAEDWYASVRMQSNRTVGMETTNKENMKCYFVADGALLTRISGDEYYNISPCWNWKHIPGVTSYDNGKKLWGIPKRDEDGHEGGYNDTPLVFGRSEGEYMVAAMEYVRDGMYARKAWFFTPKAVVCLGTGISRDEDEPVLTTLEQNVLQGEVASGKNWVSHRGITYVVLDRHQIHVSESERVGTWREIAPFGRDEDVRMDVFDAWIEHGNAPRDESYAYVVAPSCKAAPSVGAARAKAVRKSIKVVKNCSDTQVVRVDGKTLSVDWSSGAIAIL